MKNKIVWTTIMAFIALSFSILPSCASQANKQQSLKQREIEHFLKKADIVSVEINPEGGRTEPWKVMLNDGKIMRRGLFKYVNSPRHVNSPRPYILPDSYKYEIAAYELNKLLDLDIVPPVVEREVNGIKGSLQVYVENCISLNSQRRKKIKPPDEEEFQNFLEIINIFENLTYCERKELDDILIHTEDWKGCRVDVSEAFAPIPELIPEHQISRCSNSLYLNLQKLTRDEIKDKLETLINDDEIDALMERKKLIIHRIQQLIMEKGKESVLF